MSKPNPLDSIRPDPSMITPLILVGFIACVIVISTWFVFAARREGHTPGGVAGVSQLGRDEQVAVRAQHISAAWAAREPSWTSTEVRAVAEASCDALSAPAVRRTIQQLRPATTARDAVQLTNTAMTACWGSEAGLLPNVTESG